MERILYLLIAALAAAGFTLAFNIYHKKITKKPLVCPLRGHCEAVIHSDYSKFLGIPLELIGMLYYLLIFVSYLSFVIFPDIQIPHLFVMGVTFSTGIAFIFSLYLTSIQAFVLKQWCTWCLLSASICTLIFLTVVQASVFDMIPYLIEFKRVLVGAHLVGVVIGFGGAIMADIFFFKFLKDFKISDDESKLLHSFSQIIWMGLGIIITSGILIFLTNPDGYLESSKFLAKMFIVGVIAINGFFLNILISPNLTKIPFGEIATPEEKKFRNFRKLAFGLGAISATSWWITFALGVTTFIPLPYYLIIGAYFFILLGAVISSQIMELILFKLKNNKAPTT